MKQWVQINCSDLYIRERYLIIKSEYYVVSIFWRKVYPITLHNDNKIPTNVIRCLQIYCKFYCCASQNISGSTGLLRIEIDIKRVRRYPGIDTVCQSQMILHHKRTAFIPRLCCCKHRDRYKRSYALELVELWTVER